MRLNPWWLYARSHGAALWITGLALVAVTSELIPHGAVTIPMRNLAMTRLFPLLAVLPGLIMAGALSTPGAELESTSTRSVRTLRACWLVVLLTTSTMVVGQMLGYGGLGAVVVRNHLFAAGLTAACATVVPATIAWLPLGVYTAANGLYGTIDTIATPRWWALLQQPATDVPAMVVALVIATAGLSLWLWSGAQAPGANA